MLLGQRSAHALNAVRSLFGAARRRFAGCSSHIADLLELVRTSNEAAILEESASAIECAGPGQVASDLARRSALRLFATSEEGTITSAEMKEKGFVEYININLEVK